MFSSLSSARTFRMRSALSPGDAAVLKAFLLYRTYHGGP
jgi:hypothetical protein